MKNYTLIIATILCTAVMGTDIKQNVTLNDFSAGRLGPLMNSRVDLAQYRKGAKTFQNMLVRTQGPIQRRPGTKYIASVKDATDETRLIPFADSNDFIVEIGDSYARFFTDGAPVADPNGATQFELDTPWDANDVFELQYATAEGSMRIVHGDYEPYVLQRTDDTNDASWTCTAIGSTTGPFLDENTDTTLTLTASDTTGSITLTAANTGIVNDFSADSECVALWKMEINSLLIDSIGTNTLTNAGGNYGVSVDTTNYQEGVSSASLAKATPSRLYILDGDLDSGFPLKSGETNRTFSATFWIRPTTVSAAHYIMSKATVAGQYSFILGIDATNHINLQISADGTNFSTGAHASTLTVDQWYHVGVTFLNTDNSYRIRIWDVTAGAILGSDKTGTLVTPNIGTDPFYLGYPDTSTIDGNLDEVLFFSDVLTADEIDEIRGFVYGIADPESRYNPIFESCHVGSLFQISHALAGDGITKIFWTNNYPGGTEESGTIAVKKYQYYDVITDSDWRGTILIQRSYDNGASWETVYSFSNNYLNPLQYAGREWDETCIYRLQMVGQYVTQHNFDHYEKSCNTQLNTRAMTYNGTVEITSVTDANNAVADVKIELGSTESTWRWAEGAWGDCQGWPRTVEYHEQRVIYGGTSSSPETVWASIIAETDSDYDDFTANTESDIEGNLGGPDDIAWIYRFPGMGDAQWIRSGKYLFCGTTKGVMMLGQPGRPITPNFPPIARMQNYNACAFLQPASAAAAILYVEKGGKKIRELGYTNTRDTYIAPDMTVLSDDITGDGIVDLAFQNRPDPVLWCVREDGTLISFTYQRSDGIAAWSRHVSTDDDFESVAQIPGDDSDELWALINRTVDSASVKYIEQFQFDNWNPTDQNDYWFVDSGATDCNALSWLEGETVAVLADSKPIGTYTVSSGAITASGYVNYVIGLPYTSAYETMPLILYNNSGPVMGEYTDIMNVKVKFYQSMGCHIGTDATNSVDWEFSEDEFATTLERVTDFKEAPFVWEVGQEVTIYMAETDPIPMSIEAIHALVETTYDY